MTSGPTSNVSSSNWWRAPAEVTDAEAARLTETYQVLLDVIGHGVTLTQARPGGLREQVSDLLLALGWRTDHYSPPSAHSPPLVALEQLAGSARQARRRTGLDLAVAATARAVIRRG